MTSSSHSSTSSSVSFKNQSLLGLFQSITLQEWVSVAVMASAMGVAYWAWTLLWTALYEPTLKPLGLGRLLDGFWLMAPILFGYIFRKPSLAVFGSLVASAVQALITQWGMSSLIYGLLQGLGAELVFAVFLYRYWNWTVLLLAASLSAVFSFAYDYVTGGLADLTLWFNLSQLGLFVVSAWVLAAAVAMYLAQRLLKTGILDGFLIARQ